MEQYLQQLLTGLKFADPNPCTLMCHFVHVTGPEAQTLMNKEHVRLLKLWQHFPKTFNTVGDSFEMDLSFLHPVTTLIVTIRRQGDMNSITERYTI